VSLTFGSLFAGIGGLDLGLERAGMQCRWQVEINDYATKVLEKHWPNVTRFRDVRDCGKENLERVDLICGGFPCQPVSTDGKGAGELDPRWLWPELYRILCEIKPRWMLAENVAGLLSNNSGRTFAGVLRDLAASGYNAEWGSIPASAVGAFHRRKRVFLVAHSHQQQSRLLCGRAERTRRAVLTWGNSSIERRRTATEREEISTLATGSKGWSTEPELARLVHGVPGRMDRHRRRALGNAVVPQVAQWIGERIMQAHDSQS